MSDKEYLKAVMNEVENHIDTFLALPVYQAFLPEEVVEILAKRFELIFEGGEQE